MKIALYLSHLKNSIDFRLSFHVHNKKPLAATFLQYWIAFLSFFTIDKLHTYLMDLASMTSFST